MLIYKYKYTDIYTNIASLTRTTPPTRSEKVTEFDHPHPSGIGGLSRAPSRNMLATA